MITAHQLARQLLAGPDVPILHYDPSFVDSCTDGADTTLGTPVVELNDPLTDYGLDPETLARLQAEGCSMTKFLTISGDQPEEYDRPAIN